jgi:L-ascorbate metabolism protein UlaG (beta-lactamase superfamily)
MTTTDPEAPPAALPVRAHGWHDTRHHVPGGFRNPWPLKEVPGEVVPGRLEAARWMLSFPFRSRRKPHAPTPYERCAPADLAAPVTEGTARVTWLGHSTCLVRFPTVNVLTDPVFAERASPFSFMGPLRRAVLPLDPADLPPVHLVVLSHDHYDHLDPAALRALHARHRPRFVVPLGVDRRLPAGWDVTVLDWGQYVDVGGLRVHGAPARHFSGRTLRDRNRTLWASFFLEPIDKKAPTVYYAADSGYAPHFRLVREQLGAPDLVLMPVGAYAPRWFMRPVHVDPPEALDALEDLGARALVPIHWGTFDLADEPLDEPPRVLLAEAEKRGLAERIHVLPVGGTTTVTT